jgi:hypothetical protein
MYSITIEDIQLYLSTILEDGPVGTPQHMSECLIAKTLQWKYPHVGSHVRYGNGGAYVAGSLVEFPVEVYLAAEKFDSLWPLEWNNDAEYGEPITRAILRERMPELFEGQGESNV